MGNCVLHKRLRAYSMNYQKSRPIKHITTVVSNDVDNKADIFTDLEIKSPISDKGDRCSNWVQSSPKFISRIPVLATPTKNHNLSKSLLFTRSSKSRIPKTQTPTPVEQSTHQLKHLNKDSECSHSQLIESGFVSDFSVTNSGYSQTNMELKPDQGLQTFDIINNTKSKYGKSENPLPIEMLFQADEGQNLRQIKLTSCKQLLIGKDPETSCNTELQQINTVNIIKRPQSLSCESELLINKCYNKRMSEIGTNQYSGSPSPLYQDNGSILQEVSQLKLMLHKLKRCLLQETQEIIKQDSLFRPDTPLCTDIKLLSRDELEQKYEKLLVRNIHLERLLQSREKVITQIQTEKECSFEVYCRSPVESNPNEFFSPKNIKSISDIPPLKYQSVQCSQSQK